MEEGKDLINHLLCSHIEKVCGKRRAIEFAAAANLSPDKFHRKSVTDTVVLNHLKGNFPNFADDYRDKAIKIGPDTFSNFCACCNDSIRQDAVGDWCNQCAALYPSPPYCWVCRIFVSDGSHPVICARCKATHAIHGDSGTKKVSAPGKESIFDILDEPFTKIISTVAPEDVGVLTITAAPGSPAPVAPAPPVPALPPVPWHQAFWNMVPPEVARKEMFQAKLGKNAVNIRRGPQLRIPDHQAFFAGKEHVNLTTQDGKAWKVKVFSKKTEKGTASKYFGAGFADIVREYNLNEHHLIHVDVDREDGLFVSFN